MGCVYSHSYWHTPCGHSHWNVFLVQHNRDAKMRTRRDGAWYGQTCRTVLVTEYRSEVRQAVNISFTGIATAAWWSIPSRSGEFTILRRRILNQSKVGFFCKNPLQRKKVQGQWSYTFLTTPGSFCVLGPFLGNLGIKIPGANFSLDSQTFLFFSGLWCKVKWRPDSLLCPFLD